MAFSGVFILASMALSINTPSNFPRFLNSLISRVVIIEFVILEDIFTDTFIPLDFASSILKYRRPLMPLAGRYVNFAYS